MLCMQQASCAAAGASVCPRPPTHLVTRVKVDLADLNLMKGILCNAEGGQYLIEGGTRTVTLLVLLPCAQASTFAASLQLKVIGKAYCLGQEQSALILSTWD